MMQELPVASAWFFSLQLIVMMPRATRKGAPELTGASTWTVEILHLIEGTSKIHTLH